MVHLLVTNDFPPKVGGIQSYLWEMWRRLPSGMATVLTTPYPGAGAFDARAPMRIRRTPQKVLFPTPALVRRIVALAHEIGTDLVVLDPALPLGLVGPALARKGLRYAVVLHGAEVTVPGRLPLTSLLLRHALSGAEHVIAAGGYPLAEAERTARRRLPATVIPPGVDVERLRPLDAPARAAARARFGLGGEPLVVGVSRLVPRKGFDVLIEAVGQLRSQGLGVKLAIGGAGRDRRRLERVAGRHAPEGTVAFLGRLSDEDLADLYAAGDVFAMICRNRWMGLEQEGFGIVFVEASACGVAVMAGRSGGAHEAVADGVTGMIVSDPRCVTEVAGVLRSLFADPKRRAELGAAGRDRVMRDLTYDILARRLEAVLSALDPPVHRPPASFGQNAAV